MLEIEGKKKKGVKRRREKGKQDKNCRERVTGEGNKKVCSALLDICYLRKNVTVLLQKKDRSYLVLSVRYHCGGWSEEVNSCILILSYMVYL